MSNEIALVPNGRVDIESLISMGITQKLNVDVMERLFVMRTQLKEEFAKEQFYKALAKFQSETPAIPKSKKVKYETKAGGYVDYHYAPIEVIVDTVKVALEKNGFSYTLKTDQTDVKITVTCEAHHVDGHTERTSLTVPMKTGDKMNEIQQIGSAITYAKRYSFCNAFGLMTADEDTDNVTETEEPSKKEQPKTEQPKATEEIPTTITVKVTGIKDNAWLKTKDDNGKEVLSHNQIAVEKNSYGIEEIGVPKARTDKTCLAGSICKFENITSKVSAKNGKTYYNATEVNTIL